MKLLLIVPCLLMFAIAALAQRTSLSPQAGPADQMLASSDTDLVKVYVKQDPATYTKTQADQPRIDFSVQVAASSRPVSISQAKSEWEGLGPVYVQNENGMYKVRIGPYDSQMEAKSVLLEVKSKGRKDAFIVVRQEGQFDEPMDRSSPETMEKPVVVTAEDNNLPVGDYKVRVASYLHPGAFNADDVDHLGTLESYRKGEWTIMMIGGFTSMEAAEKARKEVHAKGYKDAAVVVERNGIIETVIK